MYTLVLLRHGQSTWNLENRFTGWTDVPLTKQGEEEAVEAGKLLKEAGYMFDLAFTSVLVRATETLRLVLEEMDLVDIEIKQSWRLNERHYGALQGLNKAETAAKYGNEQVQSWRRSYDVRPPALKRDDERYPGHDSRYRNLAEKDIPLTECLKDNVTRTLPYWESDIAPAIKAGKKILVSAHGNSLRALVKYLDAMPDDEIVGFNIPTGIPLIYELGEDLKPIKREFLGDPAEIEKKINAIKAQGKAT